MQRPNKADLLTVRRSNRQVIVDAVRRGGPISRAELSRRSQLSKVTVSDVVEDLIGEGYLRDMGPGPADVGRKPTLLEFVGGSGFVAGLEIAPQYLRVILTDLMGEAVCGDQRNIAVGSAQELLAAVCALISQMRSCMPSSPYQLLGVGVAVSGLVDYKEGAVLSAPNMPWAPLSLRDLIEGCLEIPAIIDNEANAAMWYEHLQGEAKNLEHAVYLSAGYGLGAGILAQGSLYRGSRGLAGEMGHMIVEQHGLACSCGNRGCWEMYASEKALRRLLGEPFSSPGAAPENFTRHVVQLARDGDSRAQESLRAVGQSLGQGIVNIASILNPQVVVLGNVLAEAWEFLYPEIVAALDGQGLSPVTQNVAVRRARNYRDAVVKGAAALACEASVAQI